MVLIMSRKTREGADLFGLLKYLRRREWLYAACAVLFIVAQVWLDLKMPDYMNTVTQIAQGRVTAEVGATRGLSDIWASGGFMLLCAIGSLVCSIISSYFIVHIGVDFSTRIREAVYTKVQGFSLGEVRSLEHGMDLEGFGNLDLFDMAGALGRENRRRVEGGERGNGCAVAQVGQREVQGRAVCCRDVTVAGVFG
jgi:ABC-type multidrug transport system fused ATPase/permease subunit